MTASSGDDSFETKLSLHAAIKTVPRALVAQQELGLLIAPKTRAELKALWAPRHATYKKTSDPARTIALNTDVRPIVGVSEDEMSYVVKRARNYPPYDRLPIELAMIGVSHLVTPQLTVTEGRGVTLVPSDRGTSDRAMFDSAFPKGTHTPTLRRETRPTGPWSAEEHFSSDDPDARIHVPPTLRKLPVSANDPESDQDEAVCFFVGRGVPFVAVNAVPLPGGRARFVISNGIHRAYRWVASGADFIPAVFVKGAGGTPTGQVGDFSWSLMMNPAAQVPLLTDFLRPEVTMSLRFHREIRRMTLKWEYESHPEPALTESDLD